MEYNKITLDNIINYCQKNNEVAWLKEEVAKTIVTEEGKERKVTFIELKRAFVLKFMPEIAPKAAAPKKPSMYERIASL